jgi:hypothetical protein
MTMLVECPNCHAQIDAGPLPPGATASCPLCQGVFQTPLEAPAAQDTAAKDVIDDPQPTGSLAGTLGWAFLFMCLFALVGAGSGYLVFRFAESRQPRRTPDLTAAQREADANTTWRALGHWSGVGMKRTPPIRATSSRWRIHWSASPLSPETSDNFALHVCDLSGKQLQTPVSIVGSGNDTATVTLTPGRYVLEIFTFETRWEVTVEEPAP